MNVNIGIQQHLKQVYLNIFDYEGSYCIQIGFTSLNPRNPKHKGSATVPLPFIALQHEKPNRVIYWTITVMITLYSVFLPVRRLVKLFYTHQFNQCLSRMPLLDNFKLKTNNRMDTRYQCRDIHDNYSPGVLWIYTGVMVSFSLL